MYEQFTDEELISRYRQGEDGILDYLMEKYKGLVRQKTRAIYLIGAEAEDLIQEGMIGLFKAVRDYQEEREASFVTFAGMCIERQIFNAITSSNRQKNLPLNGYIPLETDGGFSVMMHLNADDPENIIIDQENTRSLRTAITRELSRMENEVLTCYLSGESYARIGERMGKSPKAIDNALQRIRRKIREILNNRAEESKDAMD